MYIVSKKGKKYQQKRKKAFMIIIFDTYVHLLTIVHTVLTVNTQCKEVEKMRD